MMAMFKKILFITGSRADFGKIKSLISAVEQNSNMEAYIFVSGMHLQKEFGDTYRDVLNEGFINTYIDYSQINSNNASLDCGNIIINLTSYVNKIHPDLIVVHGDRIEALAGAIVGALNNIFVAHIEGGELSGTIDDSIRHAVSKLSTIHLVCNEDAKMRLIQLGEQIERIFIMGSPDIDIMKKYQQVDNSHVIQKYNLQDKPYAIMIYHPVTTEIDDIRKNVRELFEALDQTEYAYIVIYPNNDLGHEIILQEYKVKMKCSRYHFLKSVPFEDFLLLLRNAQFIIGNSSAGIREAGIYGVPTIDIGTRQNSRIIVNANSNIQHVDNSSKDILKAIEQIHLYKREGTYFGDGNSTQRFIELLESDIHDRIALQKVFIDFRR